MVEFSVDKVIEVDQGMNKAKGMILEEGILGIKWECIKINIWGERIIDVNIEETIGMKIMKEAGVGLETGHIQVKQEGMIEGTDIGTIKQEIDQDWHLKRLNDTSGDINPYRKLIVNNAEKVDTILSQMEQWLILSNVVNYIQYDRHAKNFYSLDIKAVNQRNDKKGLIQKKRGKC